MRTRSRREPRAAAGIGRILAASTLALTLCASALAGQIEQARPVSPGGTDAYLEVEGRCPTFSWAAATGPHELVVYDLSAEAAATDDGAPASLRVLVEAGADSFTPSLDRCLEPGHVYGWTVRALEPSPGEEPSDVWPEVRLFRIALSPPAATGASPPHLLGETRTGGSWDRGGEALADGAAKDSAMAEADETSREQGDQTLLGRSISTASAAVRGEQTDASGETYGVSGVGHSVDGAGVGAANAAGGADLVLDGTLDGETNTLLRQSGLDRPSLLAETFEIGNSGGGGMTLTVDGLPVFTTANDGPGSGLAADFLDNLTSSDVALSSHNHDGTYAAASHNHNSLYASIAHSHADVWVDSSGDTMTGTLALSPIRGPALVTTAGDVGIGVATPSQELDVAGDVNFTGALYRGGALWAHQPSSSSLALGTGALASLATNRTTGVGVSSLAANTTGFWNSAFGFGSLELNESGNLSTALGTYALNENVSGSWNTGVGAEALRRSTTTSENTAVGFAALRENGGGGNTAVGSEALRLTTTGGGNTGVGKRAGYRNTTGGGNTAVGQGALRENELGSSNTAVGQFALHNTTGSDNIAVGQGAGISATTGSDNIYIGSSGVAAESATIRIGDGGQTRTFLAAVRGVTTDDANTVPVVVAADGQLGTISSSRRVKHDIRDMGRASAAVMGLRPVTFRYNHHGTSGEAPIQYGLVAEEVAEVFPELVAFDAAGRPETVLYHVLPSLLLNELQRQARRIAELEARIEALSAAVP